MKKDWYCMPTTDHWPFETALDENNRWVKMSQCIPWDNLAAGSYQGLSVKQGRLYSRKS